MLLWERISAVIYTGNERMWIHSGFKKIRFDQGRPPENSLFRVDGPDDPTFQNLSVEISSEFYIQDSFEAAD